MSSATERLNDAAAGAAAGREDGASERAETEAATRTVGATTGGTAAGAATASAVAEDETAAAAHGETDPDSAERPVESLSTPRRRERLAATCNAFYFFPHIFPLPRPWPEQLALAKDCRK